MVDIKKPDGIGSPSFVVGELSVLFLDLLIFLLNIWINNK